MIALVVALALAAQADATGGLTSEATLYFEANDSGLVVEESWALRNLGAAPAPPAALTIQLPPEAQQARAEAAESSGFALADDGKSLHGTAPLPPGETRVLTVRYGMPLDGSRYAISRVLPFALSRARIITEDRAGLTLSGNERTDRSTRELNGIRFVIWEVSNLASGRRLELTLDGLPSRTMAPHYAAAVLSLLVLAWAVRAFLRAPQGAAKATGPLAPLSGAARRERLVRAVELLDQDHASGKIDGETHARRRRALIEELAVVLRELELSATASRA